MRALYLCFPNRDALRLDLSWTHYRTLTRIENEQARQWYMNEAIEQSWSARALERQIGTLYYERLLTTQVGKHDLAPVLEEAQKHTDALIISAKDYLRDPYIFDFLGLPTASLEESKLEQALIDNPTIGLILCTENNNTVAKYSVLEKGDIMLPLKMNLNKSVPFTI